MEEPVIHRDEVTVIKTLKDTIQKFVAERQWEKFHNPKDLAISISIEAAELLENFQWTSFEESRRGTPDPKQDENISEELADVIIYSFLLGISLDLDITTAVLSKMEKNASKYPAAEFQGVFRRPQSIQDDER